MGLNSGAGRSRCQRPQTRWHALHSARIDSRFGGIEGLRGGVPLWGWLRCGCFVFISVH